MVAANSPTIPSTPKTDAYPTKPDLRTRVIARHTALVCLATSACIAISAGTIINTNTIPKARPYTNVMTVGFKNCAWLDPSYSRGARPRTVVNVVSITGRKRSAVPSIIAGIKPLSCAYSSIVVTKTIESLMIIPTIPISPTTVKMLSGTSHR